MEQEIFKDIRGFGGLYQISNFGRVKSLKKYAGTNERILVHGKTNFGYPQVSLGNGTSKKSYLVHRLVAQAFIPNPKKLPQVNHKDCNKKNNNTCNLEWITAKENMRHAFKNDRMNIAKGENNHLSKLTDRDVKAIRNLFHNKKCKQQVIAKKFNLCQSAISRIVTNTNWKHLCQ